MANEKTGDKGEKGEKGEETKPAAQRSEDAPRGYVTEERNGAPYHIAPDGYASANEGYVQQHVASQRKIAAARRAAGLDNAGE
jgi:DNA replication initiation complex subunit (GINS family)